MFDEPVLLSGDALQFRLNEIYNMSDDEDETIVDVAEKDTAVTTKGYYVETTKTFNIGSTVPRQPISGAARYGNMRQVKFQLGL